MAIVRRYRSTSRKAGVVAMAIPPQNGATTTHGSALPRSLAIFSFWAECVDVIVVPWGQPRISWRCREKWIARIPEGVNRSFRVDGRALVFDGRSEPAPVVEKSTSLEERLWGEILHRISWSHPHILRRGVPQFSWVMPRPTARSSQAVAMATIRIAGGIVWLASTPAAMSTRGIAAAMR